jgi:eukaryotic-like serine/threonine-protein kinase
MADQWRQIDSLFRRALDIAPAERSQFLAHSCAGDDDLRRAVEAMLASHDQASRFPQQPLVQAAAPLEQSASKCPTYAAGSRIGPYEIVRLLGAGGTGEVYLALDTRLGREVAVKIAALERRGRHADLGRAVYENTR